MKITTKLILNVAHKVKQERKLFTLNGISFDLLNDIGFVSYIRFLFKKIVLQNCVKII